ncbi:MAG: putative Glycosyl transferase family 2-containing domain [Rhodospirillales bacterium]|nr:putative Glycosyl transferase family 2-containing domain [Rhodospirillales bacterium]
MTTVSYVVTLYNKRRFLPHLLAGLSGQEGAFGRQIIFVDDGSTDGTVELLKELTAGWENVVLLHQENAGPAAATNAGIAVAGGQFIKPVDGDDMLAPWATKYLLSAIESSGCRVAYGEMARVASYRPGEPPEQALSGVGQEPIRIHREQGSLDDSLHSARTNPSSWLATRDIIRQTRGCDRGVFVQDYSVELRLAAATDFARVENTLFFAPREAEERLSTNKAQILHDCNLALLRFLRDRPDLDLRFRAYGMRRASGRAWAWARRHGGKGMRSREFACYALSLLGLLPPTKRNEDFLVAPFSATSAIRLTA